MSDVKEILIYQFEKSLDLPIYVKLETELAKSLEPILKEMRFEKLAGADIEKAESQVLKSGAARVLKIATASMNISAQIQNKRESDLFGQESISPVPAGKIYRYRGVALMLYSFRLKEWQLGVINDPLVNDPAGMKMQVVINRYLSWSLSLYGVVGFWGSFREGKAIIQKQKDGTGSVFFVDILNQRVITRDGVSQIKGKLSIARPSSAVKGRAIIMSKEELLSFLHHNSVYFDYSGPSVPVRQVIQKISLVAQGVISATPTTEDLSL